MPSKFEVTCRSARSLIAVPDIPFDAIRNGARRANSARPKRRFGFGAAVLAGLSIIAAAAATELLGVRIFFDPTGPMHIFITGGNNVPNPTRADFQAAIDQMTFPVLLPVGLPAGTTPINLSRAAKSALFITYNLPGQWRRSNHLLEVVLADPRVVTTKNAPAPHMRAEFEYGGTAGTGGVLWHVGGEDLIVLHSTMTRTELAHFKKALMAAAASKAGNAAAISAVPTANPATAANLPHGTRVSFEKDGTLRLSSDGIGEDSLFDPADMQAQKSAARATFPMILPSGLPPGTKITNFSRGPKAAVIFYDLPSVGRASDHLLKVMLIDPKIIVASDPAWGRAKVEVRFPGARNATRWNIGHEEVIFLRSTLTPAEMARVHASMLAAAAKQH